MATPSQGFSIGDIHEAIAATRPAELCLVFRDRRLTIDIPGRRMLVQ